MLRICSILLRFELRYGDGLVPVNARVEVVVILRPRCDKAFLLDCSRFYRKLRKLSTFRPRQALESVVVVRTRKIYLASQTREVFSFLFSYRPLWEARASGVIQSLCPLVVRAGTWDSLFVGD